MRDNLLDDGASPTNRRRVQVRSVTDASIHVGDPELRQLRDTVDGLLRKHHDKVQHCIQTWAAHVLAEQTGTPEGQPWASKRELSLLMQAARMPLDTEQPAAARPVSREAWSKSDAPLDTEQPAAARPVSREAWSKADAGQSQGAVQPVKLPAHVDDVAVEDVVQTPRSDTGDAQPSQSQSQTTINGVSGTWQSDSEDAARRGFSKSGGKFTNTIGPDWYSCTYAKFPTQPDRTKSHAIWTRQPSQFDEPELVGQPACELPEGPAPTIPIEYPRGPDAGSEYSSYSGGQVAQSNSSVSNGWRDKVHGEIAPPRMSWQRRQSITMKFRNDRMHANDYLTQKARHEAKAVETPLERFVTSKHFEWASIALIISNIFFIGLHTAQVTNEAYRASVRGEPHDEAIPATIRALQVLFCLGFTMELALRWGADGLLNFLRTKERGWNLFDTVIVVVNIAEVVVENAGWVSAGRQNIMVLRVFRILRLVRITRVIRVVRFFRDLRIMVHTIISSVKSLIWVVTIVCGLLYIFGISLTWGAYESYSQGYEYSSEAGAYGDDDGLAIMALRQDFGTLDRSVLSLYMAIIGGRDWGEYLKSLEAASVIYRMQFLFYITFTILAVMNVITGVFVESAFEYRRADRDLVIQEALHQKNSFEMNVKELFREIDIDDSGSIELRAFQELTFDPRAVAFFTALELDINEATTLFHLLDTDKSGRVDTDEFIRGCQKLRGQARNVDVAALRKEIGWLREMFLGFADFVEEKFHNQQRIP